LPLDELLPPFPDDPEVLEPPDVLEPPELLDPEPPPLLEDEQAMAAAAKRRKVDPRQRQRCRFDGVSVRAWRVFLIGSSLPVSV
jgi:hypothetical protein